MPELSTLGSTIRTALDGQSGVAIYTEAEQAKLVSIESGATADQSNAEIETAYNAQVSVVSQAEAEAGTATTVRRWTAERVKQAIAALASGGAGTWGSITGTLASQTDLQSALDAKQADLSVPSQAEAEAGVATTERVWTAQRIGQAIAALASGGTWGSIGGTLSNQTDLQTALNAKQADLAVPSQAEAEAGTATTERVWTAQRVGQAVAALSAAGGTKHTIQDEGSALTARAALNFVGAGVSAVDDSGNNRTTVTIGGGSGLPGNFINVMDFSGISAANTSATATRSAINTAIAQCNAASNAQRLVLYFPPGEYAINGTLTTADGDYSIIMEDGAMFMYTPATMNAVMWQIGSPAVQNDGQGIIHFKFAAECTGVSGANLGNTNNVGFEVVNIKHCRVTIMRANDFHTGLRMTADAESDGNKHMYDVTVQLGFLHACVHNLVQRTRYNGWMNNIRYYNGDFSQASGFACRYINMINEGTFGQAPRGGENKAVFYEPLCDGNDNSHNLTALYVVGSASAMCHGGHMEGPTYVIEHATDAGAPAGSEPCVWIAPRLEAKQFKVLDPDDIGSWCYDPFWGPGAKPKHKEVTASRDLTTGDVRAGRMLFNKGTSNFQVSIPDFGGGAQEPPLNAMVHFHQRSTGTLEAVDDGTGVALLIPASKLAKTRGLGSVFTAQLISLDGEDVPVSLGANQVWAIYGDLADA